MRISQRSSNSTHLLKVWADLSSTFIAWLRCFIWDGFLPWARPVLPATVVLNHSTLATRSLLIM